MNTLLTKEDKQDGPKLFYLFRRQNEDYRPYWFEDDPRNGELILLCSRESNGEKVRLRVTFEVEEV